MHDIEFYFSCIFMQLNSILVYDLHTLTVSGEKINKIETYDTVFRMLKRKFKQTRWTLQKLGYQDGCGR